MAPAAAPEPSYRKDEKVYCFHHELLYEAKVLEVKSAEEDDKKSGFQYRVHYKGWKNTYVFIPSSSRVLVPSPGLRMASVMFVLVCTRFLFSTNHFDTGVYPSPGRLSNNCCCNFLDCILSLTLDSWDDWVPEDRLRKLSPENRELANNLRHEMLAAQRAARAQPLPSKKKVQGSTRGSEERQTSVSAAPRGQKRMRDHDLEKASAFPCHAQLSHSHLSSCPFLGQFTDLIAGRGLPKQASRQDLHARPAEEPLGR